MECTEENGVKAIKFLQCLADVPETDEQAKKGWRSMSAHEQKFTLDVYNRLATRKDAAKVVETMIDGNPDAKRRRDNDLDRA